MVSRRPLALHHGLIGLQLPDSYSPLTRTTETEWQEIRDPAEEALRSGPNCYAVADMRTRREALLRNAAHPTPGRHPSATRHPRTSTAVPAGPASVRPTVASLWRLRIRVAP
jgi:hypothetical protein